MQSAMSPGKSSGDADAQGNQGQSSGSSLGESVTLAAIKGLLQESLDPLTSSVKDMKNELSDFKHEVKEDINQVKTRVGKVEDNMKMSNIRMKELEGKFEQEFPINPELQQKIKDIEESVKNITFQKPAGAIGASSKYSDSLTNTLVMGGLKVSLAAATQWANKLLAAAQGTLPKEIYKKGPPDEAFKGLLFLKFKSSSEADVALGVLQAGVHQENLGKDVKSRLWVEFESPIEQRVCDGFLIDLRKQLIEWQYPPACIEIDKEIGVLKVATKAVVKVDVVDNEFRSTYVNEEFAKWQELQKSPELNAITNKAKDRLAKSRAKFSKGIGKGALQ